MSQHLSLKLRLLRINKCVSKNDLLLFQLLSFLNLTFKVAYKTYAIRNSQSANNDCTANPPAKESRLNSAASL